MRIIKHEDVPIPGHGAGRLMKIHEPIKLGQAVEIVKQRLNLKHVRLALAKGQNMGKKNTNFFRSITGFLNSRE